jgi:hypothetical protein
MVPSPSQKTVHGEFEQPGGHVVLERGLIN